MGPVGPQSRAFPHNQCLKLCCHQPGLQQQPTKTLHSRQHGSSRGGGWQRQQRGRSGSGGWRGGAAAAAAAWQWPAAARIWSAGKSSIPQTHARYGIKPTVSPVLQHALPVGRDVLGSTFCFGPMMCRWEWTACIFLSAIIYRCQFLQTGSCFECCCWRAALSRTECNAAACLH